METLTVTPPTLVNLIAFAIKPNKTCFTRFSSVRIRGLYIFCSTTLCLSEIFTNSALRSIFNLSAFCF